MVNLGYELQTFFYISYSKYMGDSYICIILVDQKNNPVHCIRTINNRIKTFWQLY